MLKMERFMTITMIGKARKGWKTFYDDLGSMPKELKRPSCENALPATKLKLSAPTEQNAAQAESKAFSTKNDVRHFDEGHFQLKTAIGKNQFPFFTIYLSFISYQRGIFSSTP